MHFFPVLVWIIMASLCYLTAGWLATHKAVNKGEKKLCPKNTKRLQKNTIPFAYFENSKNSRNSSGGWQITVSILGVVTIMMLGLYFFYFLSSIKLVGGHTSLDKTFFIFVSIVTISNLGKYCLPPMPIKKIYVTFLCWAFSISLTLSWVKYPGFVTYGVTGCILIIVVLTYLRNIMPKTVLLLYAGLCIYDAGAVFGTGVMGKVADNASYPASLCIPESISEIKKQPSFNSPSKTENTLSIGLGDILSPGLLIMVALRESKKCKAPGLAIGSFIGCAIGALISSYAAFKFTAQPATIYLLPCTTLGFLIGGYMHGIIRKIFRPQKILTA